MRYYLGDHELDLQTFCSDFNYTEFPSLRYSLIEQYILQDRSYNSNLFLRKIFYKIS